MITLDILLGPFRAYCHIYFHLKQSVKKQSYDPTDTYTNIQSHYVNNLVNVSLTGFQLLSESSYHCQMLRCCLGNRSIRHI